VSTSPQHPDYLQPYVDAVRKHGTGFKSLLWASPKTQKTRFEALRRVCDFEGRSVLDVGCGRADLLDHLMADGVTLEHYVGLEAVGELAEEAAARKRPRSRIVRGDFVSEPARMFVGADVIVFCGSLNTLSPATFYDALRTAYEATAEEVVFNFLCSDQLAAAAYLHWHQVSKVLAFARELGGEVDWIDDYLPGDCTMRIRKRHGD
jgi:hypothetical protein